MRTSIHATTAVFLMFLVSAASAQQDAAGSADHPLVGRYEGAVLDSYRFREYDEVLLPDRPLPPRDRADSANWMRELEGRIYSLRYVAPQDRTTLEVVRNHQRSLEEQGFDTVFFCRGGSQCTDRGSMGDFWQAARAGISMVPNWGDESVYLLAERNDADGRVHVAIFAHPARQTGFEGTRAILAVNVVESEPMQSDMIAAPRLVEAGEFDAAFAQDGRIAVYGITFEFDSDQLLPEAREQIAVLGAVLRDNPSLEVVIVGHTDSIGSFDYNLALSQRRAVAVVEALARDHSIARERLTPAGAGMMSPAATNRTDGGRALNRRVEIVERVSR